MPSRRQRAVASGRKAIKRGTPPIYTLEMGRGRVVEMPWLDFDGRRPAERVEAARRAIAAELDVRPHTIRVQTDGPEPVGLD